MTAVHRFQERSSLVIRGGDVLDPSGRRSADVLVVGNEIVEVAESIEAPSGAVEVDATDAVIASGLVDLHTHLREPGNEDAETIETGSRGAALGGYTAVLAMPNTTPCIDSASMVREILYLGRDASCTVQPVGAITVGRGGKRLSAMGDMAALGVTMFTDDGNGVASSGIMRRALEYATGLGVTLAQHCEDPSLAAGGVMHEGAWSSRLGVPGQPAIAEEIMVQRDLALARLTGARLHFQHLSTAGSVELVRAAKSAGLAVTAEVTTHHLLLTDAACASYDATFRVNPPLRSNDDVAALRAGLADGTIDAIATDHAPHTPEAKERPFDEAPPGMLGLETALAVAVTELGMALERVFELMSWRPAEIGRMVRHGRPVAAGEPANLCIFDPSTEWTVSGAAMASMSRNTPYEGRSLRGRVRHTIHEGALVVSDGQAQQ